MEIAKAGWLYRQSSVLRRWKKSWFVLYTSGDLSYFETPDSARYEEKIVVRAVCTGIQSADRCDFHPPDGRSKHCLLQLDMRSGKDDWKLCAESPDDMKAWNVALEEARVMNHGSDGAAVPQVQQSMMMYPTYPMYGRSYGYPGQVLATPGQYMVHNTANGNSMMVANGPNTNVVYMQEPTYYNRGYTRPYRGGAMMGGPLLWW